jgi:mannobiose 2-epimerase
MNSLEKLKGELKMELREILSYWMTMTLDEHFGGFVGRINGNNEVVANAQKGAVLNARLLWTFAAAYNFSGNPEYLAIADRAYQYITGHFIDQEFGGVYWSLDHRGNPLDTKKQVYAVAFAIYGISEYHIASGNTEARDLAISLYELLVAKSYDPVNTGYLEAFGREWQPIDDLRLSDKDANEKKTANTHLHVLEAYTNLYRIWPDDGLKAQIEQLIGNFLEHFISPETHQLRLFFDDVWNNRSYLISYGHDIETTWLLQRAAEQIENKALLDKVKAQNVLMADAAMQGLDADGGLWYEYEGNHLIKEKHWWVQAEAMVGFFNIWQITGEEKYLEIAERTWQYIKAKMLDKQYGEWLWGIDGNGEVMKEQNKAGFWKCPYHNSRACMEIVNRISA